MLPYISKRQFKSFVYNYQHDIRYSNIWNNIWGKTVFFLCKIFFQTIVYEVRDIKGSLKTAK